MTAIALNCHGDTADLPRPPEATHGMVVLGEQDNIYLIHLAMKSFEAHNFQLIMEVEFQKEKETSLGDTRFLDEGEDLTNTGPNEIYFKDRNHRANDTPIYTFVPKERFALTEIPEGKRHSIKGVLVRGHFENAGTNPTPIVIDVQVAIKHIVYFRDLRHPLDTIPNPLKHDRLEYLLFGARGEFFLSHKITFHAEPFNNAFHQVFQLKDTIAERFNFDATRKALLVEIDSAHSSEGWLPREGGTFPGALKGFIEDELTPLPLNVELEGEHYREKLM